MLGRTSGQIGNETKGKRRRVQGDVTEPVLRKDMEATNDGEIVAVVVVVVEKEKNIMASPAADVGRATKPAVCHTLAYEIWPRGSGRRRS
ncbi:hypothetical protein E2C01_045831 [Portunus trituberculatus]|uniref:Uncharacterized protein n=1 Tax=Portunus trituberculatus TaxID=210409 RepID=A0A5B7G620_PORTR|nr:hypothetical protein [Portunus trituberculatus]